LHYVGQAKGPFLAMAALGGAVAVLEAALFWFVGHLVDILDKVPPGSGWGGLLSGHGPALLGMVFVVLIVRFAVVSLGALVEEQVVVPGFLNLVRWQAYAPD
jgi:ATP-binding cassette subfamily B multidrug efflux pump